MSIYEKSVKLLFADMIDELGIKKGDTIKRDQVFAWFKQKYPKIKVSTISAHFLKMSVNAPSRIHYNVNPSGEDDLLFQIDAHKFRLYDTSSDPEPIYEKDIGTIKPLEETLEASVDKDNNYVVIELKVSRGYDRVVGQLLRYMAWIRKNHADAGQQVRGVIIAREISGDLLLACSEVPDITLYEYQLSVSLKRINEK